MTVLMEIWAHYNFDLQMGRVGKTVVRPLRKIISNLIYYSFHFYEFLPVIAYVQAVTAFT